MASGEVKEDKYRTHMYGEAEKNTKWVYGVPPNYDVVNKLFEEGRTKIWPTGSLEEKVQNLVKTWEMEMFHKKSTEDYKTVDPNKYTVSINDSLRCYNPAEETADSSHRAFTTTFPRGFAVEILHVYSGPPVIVYKFRHWGYMEGPFKGHAPTGEMVQFIGMSIFELDEQEKIVKVQFFYDRGELLGGLLKGSSSSDSGILEDGASTCPLMKKTG
ncbi:pathogen-related protein isoform X2 [Cannabis sativa]|uniref:Pathogen-related protein n=1 Tax=Cannabis sativa TaxID=3483 RepID=A0ABL6UGN4_CANSA|nr:pathogen-related protein isoform X2 [Cannabis sativa]